ncbi:transporter substrate-binding domain-containing protein [Nisaea acidiphila]|uniref:histidine kinase n=1 Tax=Nisaea acidiphila TaxID=1862145 RepID=A0A9J7AQJ2_9PROT|nr:transporter substrate-binding domain-containing protein [Nisaea acidiphila]UUX48865.1 transporter substrate-binding domain-containing protein [Nisaea acidiphila]
MRSPTGRRSFCRFVAACFLFAISSTCVLAADTQARKPLFLGNHSIPPLIYHVNGEARGLVVDVMRELAGISAEPLAFDTDDWSRAQDRVKEGEAQGLVQLNKNAEREEFLLFSKPLVTSEFTIFRRHDRSDIRDLPSLYGKTVGAEAGGFPRSILARHPQIFVDRIDSWAEGFRRVQRGELDAVLVDRWVGEFILAEEKISGVTVVDPPVETLESHIAVRRDLPELLAAVNDGLDRLRANGTMDQILSRWRGERVIYVTESEYFLSKIVYALFALLCVMAFGLVWALSERQRAFDRLRGQRDLLEARVQQRTSELRTEKERAEAAVESKSQFLANMSHELRTPLNAVIGFAELIESKLEVGDAHGTVRGYAGHIGISGRNLLRLINDLLDFSKIESGRLEIVEEPFVLNDQIEAIQATFEMKAREQQVTLTVHAPETRCVLVGDEGRFKQIVCNLVDNAIKFAPGGEVSMTVSVHPEADGYSMIEIVVEDNGIGIPEAKADAVFAPFSQADASITRQYGGSGLGLPISRRLARIMGGDITVDSRYGAGSRFEFTLRLTDVSHLYTSFESLKESANRKDGASLGLSVLIVDDVESNLAVTECYLKELRCEAHKARSGEQAIHWARVRCPDVVLMDINMPGMDGISAARAIRDIPGRERLPIIAWTADVTCRSKLDQSGIDWAGTIFKPATRDILLRQLRSIPTQSSSSSGFV